MRGAALALFIATLLVCNSASGEEPESTISVEASILVLPSELDGLRMLAMSGDGFAAIEIAFYFKREGVGRESDPAKAASFYLIAGALGVKASLLPHIEQLGLEPKERIKARLMAQRWLQVHQSNHIPLIALEPAAQRTNPAAENRGAQNRELRRG